MMERYEKYKESGVEWIGEIPEEWAIKKLKYVAELKSGNNLTSGQIKQDGDYPVYGGNGLRGYYNDYTHDGRFVLIGRQGALCGNIHYAKGRFWATDHAVVASPISKYPTIWFGELLKAMNLNQYSVAAAQPGLAVDAIKNLLIPYPNFSEQKNIANYLDRKTAEIDELIAQKEQLLELYEEEKNAIINQAVTKGIDPNVKLKDSGIDWLGEIPEGWEVKKLKFIISNLESGVSVNSTDYPVSGHSYGILKTSCVYNYLFDPNENKEIWQSELIRAKVNPRKGAIIISRMNTPDLVGASGYVEKDNGKLFLPDRLWQTTFIHHIEIDTKWLSFVLKSTRFRMLLSVTATGTSPSMKNLTQEDFLKIIVPFPDVDEQTTIVNHIETETTRINAKIAKTKEIIALQKEYRTALISEVVTGKIKVSHLAPEEVAS